MSGLSGWCEWCNTCMPRHTIPLYCGYSPQPSCSAASIQKLTLINRNKWLLLAKWSWLNYEATSQVAWDTSTPTHLFESVIQTTYIAKIHKFHWVICTCVGFAKARLIDVQTSSLVLEHTLYMYCSVPGKCPCTVFHGVNLHTNVWQISSHAGQNRKLCLSAWALTRDTTVIAHCISMVHVHG